MRFPRVKAVGWRPYHCISKVRPWQLYFPDFHRRLSGGPNLSFYDAPPGRFLRYSDPGLQVEPRFLFRSEVLERIQAGYGSQYVQELRDELARVLEQPARRTLVEKGVSRK
jgi:hypothetical protein